MKNLPQSISRYIISRIYGRGRGSVFTPNDFIDLGSRDAIDQSLHRLTELGTIRRVGVRSDSITTSFFYFDIN